MIEHDEGEGSLVSLSAEPLNCMVDNTLDIKTEVKGQSATFSPPHVERYYSLSIRPRAKQVIPDGEYTLKTAQEILRVRKVGAAWKVVT